MDSGDGPLPRWLVPPPDGWRAEDLDHLDDEDRRWLAPQDVQVDKPHLRRLKLS